MLAEILKFVAKINVSSKFLAINEFLPITNWDKKYSLFKIYYKVYNRGTESNNVKIVSENLASKVQVS